MEMNDSLTITVIWKPITRWLKRVQQLCLSWCLGLDKSEYESPSSPTWESKADYRYTTAECIQRMWQTALNSHTEDSFITV